MRPITGHRAEAAGLKQTEGKQEKRNALGKEQPKRRATEGKQEKRNALGKEQQKRRATGN